MFVNLESVAEAAHVKNRLLKGDHDMGRISVAYCSGPKPDKRLAEPTTTARISLGQAVRISALRAYMERFDGVRDIRFQYGAWLRSYASPVLTH